LEAFAGAAAFEFFAGAGAFEFFAGAGAGFAFGAGASFDAGRAFPFAAGAAAGLVVFVFGDFGLVVTVVGAASWSWPGSISRFPGGSALWPGWAGERRGIAQYSSSRPLGPPRTPDAPRATVRVPRRPTSPIARPGTPTVCRRTLSADGSICKEMS